ncbi:hypothetical protein DSL92_06820 [Billgrantia gudaonensis]|uniref:Uncharacterized protein n=1 Tax=Billgrantia gudaonensis TaxID=376427 RepID=A0A432JIJ4_9GAMM|nr:hypothetical protein DSL92_06820 [Halomonas gudaonensis]
MIRALVQGDDLRARLNDSSRRAGAPSTGAAAYGPSHAFLLVLRADVQTGAGGDLHRFISIYRLHKKQAARCMPFLER